MRLAGTTAVVTGSTRGIGLGISGAFAREGARVIINARSGADCAAVAKEMDGAASRGFTQSVLALGA